MTLSSLVLAALLSIGLAAPAQADLVLFTAAADAGSGGSLLRCTALNTGKKAIALVSLSLKDRTGTELAGSSCPSLGPGEVCDDGLGGPANAIYCQIAYKASRKAVRGVLQVIDANGNSVLNLEAR
jgi:hypothetical protein